MKYFFLFLVLVSLPVQYLHAQISVDLRMLDEPVSKAQRKESEKQFKIWDQVRQLKTMASIGKERMNDKSFYNHFIAYGGYLVLDQDLRDSDLFKKRFQDIKCNKAFSKGLEPEKTDAHRILQDLDEELAEVPCPQESVAVVADQLRRGTR